MAFQFAPLLIGAGMGALGGLLTGKDPLKGALIGGATGGLLGSFAPAIGAGGVGATGATATSAATNAGAAGLTSTTAGLGAGTTAGLGAGTVASSTVAPAGVNAFTEGATSAFGSMARDPLTGEILASQVPNAGVSAFTAQPSMFDGLGQYFNPRDIGNVALQGIANQPRQQMIQAPAGGISRGQAPQGQDVMALLQTIRQPERRRISLV